MKEIYSTFDAKLGVSKREGYTISEAENDNLCMMQYRVISDAKQGKWIFKPTKNYNKGTEWNIEKCLDLLCDLADGKIEILYHGNH